MLPSRPLVEAGEIVIAQEGDLVSLMLVNGTIVVFRVPEGHRWKRDAADTAQTGSRGNNVLVLERAWVCKDVELEMSVDF